ILLCMNAGRGEADQAAEWLNALARTYELRQRTAASAPVDDQAARWRNERDAKAALLEEKKSVLTAARAALDADTTDAQLQRLRAAMTDAQSRYDQDRAEAERALQAWNREQNTTEQDAARLVDPKRVAAAQQTDPDLAADLKQLQSQAALLR